MALIENMSAGRINAIGAKNHDADFPVPLPPSKFPKLTTVSAVSAGTLASKVLEASEGTPTTTLVEIICKQTSSYGFFWRWHTASDTADCTSSNAHGFVGIGHIRHFAVPSGAVKIQFLGDAGTASGILVEY